MDKGFINELHCAITSADPIAFYNYWNTCSVGQLRRDIEELTDTPEKDLKAFTMAAMQGLCAMENKSDQVFTTPEEAYQLLAKHAVGIAKATLSELSKHQHA